MELGCPTKWNKQGNFQVLCTEKLKLKELKITDSQSIFKLFSNPENIKYTDNIVAENVRESEKQIKNFRQEYEDYKSVRWGICLAQNPEIIGLISLYHIDWRHQFASISYFLSTDFRHKGFTFQAIQAVLSFAFVQLQLNRIEAQIFTDNLASITLLEKLSFIKEGRLRKNFMINGVLEDSYIYSLLKADFIKSIKQHL